MNDRTDLALERTAALSGTLSGVEVEEERRCGATITRVSIRSKEAARRLDKPCGQYWTLHHGELALLSPEERMAISGLVADAVRALLPRRGDVLVLGLGNRRMTADALGPRTADGVLVTRHLDVHGLRRVAALSPGVKGVTGMETAEMAACLVAQLKPEALVVVDALAAMETSHVGATIQVTDTGIHPGSGVGNHRQAITKETMGVPVVAVGIPMVVYASTILRDALRRILASGRHTEDAERMAEALSEDMPYDMVVTPRDVDELVAGLGDLLALALNAALQPSMPMEELSLYLH